MRYLSTRDARASPATHSFEDVLLRGLAADGGLFVPERLPALAPEALRRLAGLPYAELTVRVMASLAGDPPTITNLHRLMTKRPWAFGAVYGCEYD